MVLRIQRLATSTRKRKIMCEEVSPVERNGDVCNDELPLESAATEGEPNRFVLLVETEATAKGGDLTIHFFLTRHMVSHITWQQGQRECGSSTVLKRSQYS